MNFAEFYYQEGSDVAIARGSVPSGEYYLYSISYPLLAKTTSEAGIYSPTGEHTNLVQVIRNSGNSVFLTIPEGFHNVVDLGNAFNQAFERQFGNSDLEFISYGTNQGYIENNDTVAWSVDFLNATTTRMFTGVTDRQIFHIGPDEETQILTPDPFLGNFSMELKIQNGESLFLPTNGGWLEGGTLYFSQKIKVNFNNVNVIEMFANYSSINLVKKLHSPRVALVRLGYKRD